MTVSPPLRFLALLLGGWVCLRATVLASGWWQDSPDAAAHAWAEAPAPTPAIPLASPPPSSAPQARRPFATDQAARPAPAPVFASAAPAAPPETAFVAVSEQASAPAGPAVAKPPPFPAAPPALASPPPGTGHWSASAWLFVREHGARGLAPGGALGGSQAGGRIAYRLNGDTRRPLALSGRAYAPLGSLAGSEAAIGLDWKPFAALPLHLLAERRQALGREGRSAFSLTAYGGAHDRKLGPLTLDAYVQAGVVGTGSRDPFIDGSARLGVRAGPVKVGAGLWGAAQPGLSRLDLGPQASLRLWSGSAQFVIAADWRIRAAGDAGFKSGPALTVSTDF